MKNSRLSEVERKLEEPVSKILSHEAIQLLASGKATATQIRTFAEQYSVYCSWFPRCLAAVAANVPDDRTRHNLIENLWEEHGEGDLRESHRSLFERFMVATGCENQSEPAPFCSNYVERAFAIYQHWALP